MNTEICSALLDLPMKIYHKKPEKFVLWQWCSAWRWDYSAFFVFSCYCLYRGRYRNRDRDRKYRTASHLTVSTGFDSDFDPDTDPDPDTDDKRKDRRLSAQGHFFACIEGKARDRQGDSD